MYAADSDSDFLSDLHAIKNVLRVKGALGPKPLPLYYIHRDRNVCDVIIQARAVLLKYSSLPSKRPWVPSNGARRSKKV